MNVRPDRTTKYTKSGLTVERRMQQAIVQVQEETIDFTTISKIENVSKKLKPHPGQRFRVVNGYDGIVNR
jgi:ribosomal protein S17